MTWTGLANGLSLARILLAPAVLYGLRRSGAGVDPLTLTLLLVAGATDILDGACARRGVQTSHLGRILDPVADKLFIGTVCAGLVLWRGFPAWLLALQVGRDVAIVGAGTLLLRRRRLVIGASPLGKAATWVMALTILAHVMDAGPGLRGGLASLTAAMIALSSGGYVRRLTRLDHQARQVGDPT